MDTRRLCERVECTHCVFGLYCRLASRGAQEDCQTGKYSHFKPREVVPTIDDNKG